MEDWILIKKINPNEKLNKTYLVSFVISKMNEEEQIKKVFDICDSKDYIRSESIILRHDGVELEIETKKVPDLLRDFLKNEIEVFATYISYENN